MSLPLNQILCGDCIETMKTLPSESVDMGMFSPPYWGLRDYGISGQIGLEEHPSKYIEKIVEVCQEVKRLLKKLGSMYIVIGDTYYTHTSKRSGQFGKGIIEGFDDIFTKPRKIINDGGWLQSKQLLGIPWHVTIALQDDGWILRNDIIWNKPNHMPSSVRDRLTNAYEHIFHFVKNRKYYYDLDAIREKPVSVKASGNRQRKPSLQPRNSHVGKSIPWKPPGDTFQTKKEPYIGNNPHRMRLEPDQHIALNPDSPMDLSHPLGKNPADVLKLDSIACPSGPQRWEREGTNRVQARFHPDGKNPSDVLLYDSKYAKHEYGQTLQAFVREQTIAKRRILSRVEAEKLFPNDPKKQQEYINYIHDHDAHSSGKNPADFWNITTQPFKGAHFAVYPEAVCMRPIKSSCPPNGIVLDPMCGSGTTLAVAKKLGRKYIGIELNPQYIEIAQKRLAAIPEKITTFF